jgi:ABC-2 type transport system ATP-binding protein
VDAMIQAHRVTKSYGRTIALRGVDLAVPEGRVLGLLGPNGAGKTTLVRILSTLLPPDAGHALIAGHDVVRESVAVRRAIGLAGQHAAVDELLSGRENLQMIGRLYRLSAPEARRRATEVLERLSLTEVGDRPARTYSGGLRRRLALGACLVGRPRVLLLDEPTAGLDPAARIDLWEFVRELVAQGVTLLLTTQLLDEADELADDVVILDRGHIIAQGSPDQLKARLGDDTVDVTLTDAGQLDQAVTTLAAIATTTPRLDRRAARVSLTVQASSNALATAVHRLDEAAIGIADVTIRRPSLDDVFLAFTGHRATGSAEHLVQTAGAPA